VRVSVRLLGLFVTEQPYRRTVGCVLGIVLIWLVLKSRVLSSEQARSNGNDQIAPFGLVKLGEEKDGFASVRHRPSCHVPL
jgi:hypothetical protein